VVYGKEASCRLSLLLCINTEFLHSREQSRAVHSQARGSTVGTTYAPLACCKCPYDLIALLAFIFVRNAAFITPRIPSFSSDLLEFLQVSRRGLFCSRCFGVLRVEPRVTYPA
jgi:hypothetical protein